MERSHTHIHTRADMTQAHSMYRELQADSMKLMSNAKCQNGAAPNVSHCSLWFYCTVAFSNQTAAQRPLVGPVLMVNRCYVIFVYSQ